MSALIITSRVGTYHRVERAPERAAQFTDRPNYAARRIGVLFLALSAMFAAVSLLNSAASGFAGRPASAAGSEAPIAADAAPSPTATHVAVAGESLWSIADLHRGSVDRDRFVDALERLNGGTSIFVGQAVLLP